MKAGKTADKPLSEKETRRRILNVAKVLGCDRDLLQIFDRYDALLQRCTNDSERKQISILAAVEIHRTIGFRNPLVIDGVEILPGDPDWDKGQNG